MHIAGGTAASTAGSDVSQLSKASPHVRDKAKRLLVDGCVEVRCSSDGLRALVRGDTGTWSLFPECGRRWRCTCPSWSLCSHALAVHLVASP